MNSRINHYAPTWGANNYGPSTHLYSWVERGIILCQHLAVGCYTNKPLRRGFEPVAFRSLVLNLNHYTTKIICTGNLYCTQHEHLDISSLLNCLRSSIKVLLGCFNSFQFVEVTSNSSYCADPFIFLNVSSRFRSFQIISFWLKNSLFKSDQIISDHQVVFRSCPISYVMLGHFYSLKVSSCGIVSH